MKTIIFFPKKPKFHLVEFYFLHLGSYQNSSYDTDGIYGNPTADNYSRDSKTPKINIQPILILQKQYQTSFLQMLILILIMI
jgi:hypothetical protein